MEAAFEDYMRRFLAEDHRVLGGLYLVMQERALRRQLPPPSLREVGSNRRAAGVRC